MIATVTGDESVTIAVTGGFLILQNHSHIQGVGVAIGGALPNLENDCFVLPAQESMTLRGYTGNVYLIGRGDDVDVFYSELSLAS